MLQDRKKNKQTSSLQQLRVKTLEIFRGYGYRLRVFRYQSTRWIVQKANLLIKPFTVMGSAFKAMAPWNFLRKEPRSEWPQTMGPNLLIGTLFKDIARKEKVIRDYQKQVRKLKNKKKRKK